MKKSMNEGNVKLQLHELDGHSFTDMSFFQSRIPEGTNLVDVQFYHDYGRYDEGETSYLSLRWKRIV